MLWPGYETSIGIFDSGLLMRNDISTKVLRQDTVYDLFMECVNSRHNNSNWFVSNILTKLYIIFLLKSTIH